MADFLSPTGPLFGPDFVVVTVNDDTGVSYSLQVYPDASNADLQAAGRPTQFYWQPSRVYLARKQDSPADYDFSMTVFKGLMTSETTIGITPDQTTGGDAEVGGGFCAFTTTFAVPDSVIAHVTQALKEGNHPAPAPRLGNLFPAGGADQPDPLLGVIPITDSSVTINIPSLIDATKGTKVPMFLSAQGSGKGSIEEHGFSSFLVTCNQPAAGAIAGSLKNGASPFTVSCSLKELVYIHGCQAKVTVDVDKTFDQFSAAVSTGGFLGIDSACLDYAYSSLVTSGGISTEIQMDEGTLTPELQQWIEKNVDDMRKTAFDVVKNEIFDWKPAEQSPASTDRGIFSEIFGGSSVSLKESYQHHGAHLTQTLRLDTTIAVTQTVSGDLNDLLPAVKANLDKYLAIVDIGEYFKKIQVAGTSAVNFGEKLPDGTDLRDPIQSVQLEVAYPDFSNPQGSDGQPNLVSQAEGFHYTIGHSDPNAGSELALWTKDNPHDVVNISALRLDKDLPNWPADQVKVTKTIVFDGSDPRVELADGGSTFTVVQQPGAHAPKLTADEVGYVFVRFVLDRKITTDNVTVTLTCTLGSRTDTLTINQANQNNVLWEIFSDKYKDETSFQYTVNVEVSGPSFTDDPVTWQSDGPVTVPLPTGRLKYVNPYTLKLPSVPPEKKGTVDTYIQNSKKS
ncbi:hypothetical protein [Streptomyces hesseae]|uniref:Uncharacterized protein n=1 Tax=Streptomyces hesseae TaxID=3075519 RepID=A0ABU2ST87_9ACTN|nr:hypothetical protein [Streptomyces sp. DSM 40473]MDT0452065.1 hypothetical protein [Streptomyces sp. DSM 40473]